MKKNLNTSELESQLAGSVFFRKHKQTDLPTNQPASKEENQPNRKSANTKAVQPSPVRTSASKKEDLSQNVDNRTGTPNERTDEPNGFSERSTVLTELEEGVRETKRPTERYSFEIFTDMKEKIEDIQYGYKKKTGKKLSASRIIREALEIYFGRIEEAI